MRTTGKFLFIVLILRSVWDTEDRRKQKTVIVVKSKERGARTKVSACAYSPDGNVIAGGKGERLAGSM